VLRLAASIRQGTVTASLILRKLGSYPRQNSLAAALREIGRIERTLFTLEWLQSPDLRRRVQVGLNKGEAKNALARAVFFNRLGELRDRTFENQRYRARAQLGSGCNHPLEHSLSGTCDPLASAEGQEHFRRTDGSSLTFRLGTH
jgi:TnpA family transposase